MKIRFNNLIFLVLTLILIVSINNLMAGTNTNVFAQSKIVLNNKNNFNTNNVNANSKVKKNILAVSKRNKEENQNFEMFWQALKKVESKEYKYAVGDNKQAIGVAQIHYAYWKDATEFDKTIGGEYEYCFNVAYSKKVVYAYMNRYCKEWTFENMARCHNSGANWQKKKHLTNDYWNKIKNNLL